MSFWPCGPRAEDVGNLNEGAACEVGGVLSDINRTYENKQQDQTIGSYPPKLSSKGKFQVPSTFRKQLLLNIDSVALLCSMGFGIQLSLNRSFRRHFFGINCVD
jgi:hypothetical protein